MSQDARSRRKYLSRQAWYVPVLAGAFALMLSRSLIAARILDVLEFAKFSAALLISSTSMTLGCLGLQSLLQREMPGMFVRGRELESRILLAQSVIVAVGLAGVGVLVVPSAQSLTKLPPLFGVVAVLHGLSQQLFLLATIESRSRLDPLRFASQTFVRALCVVLLSALGAVVTGSALVVLLLEACFTFALSTVILSRFASAGAIRLGPILKIALSKLGRVDWRAAAALLLVSIVGFLIANIDRWFAAGMLTPIQFATYSFAWTLLMTSQSVQVVINSSIYPLLANRFAKFGMRTTFRVSLVSSAAVMASGALVSIPAFIALDRAIIVVYPQYASAIAILPIFILVAILRSSDFWTSYLLITNREVAVLASDTSCAILGTLIWLGLTRPWRAGFAPDLLYLAQLAAVLAILSYASKLALSVWTLRR